MGIEGLHKDYVVRIESVAPENRGGQHVGRASSGVRVGVGHKDGYRELVSIKVHARSQHKSREMALTLAEIACGEIGLLTS